MMRRAGSTNGIKMTQPAGSTVRNFRLAILIDGKPCTAERFADSLGVNVQNINDYEVEKRGKRMPAVLWLLARITWDALARAQWMKSLPKRDT